MENRDSFGEFIGLIIVYMILDLFVFFVLLISGALWVIFSGEVPFINLVPIITICHALIFIMYYSDDAYFCGGDENEKREIDVLLCAPPSKLKSHFNFKE